MNDCGENDDDNGVFFYPGGFTRARPDIGTTYSDPTMISVASVDTWNAVTQKPLLIPGLSASSSRGAQTVLMAAPGSYWRVDDIQPYPPAGLNSSTHDCGKPLERCSGTSLAAPIVGGAAVLVLANNPTLDAAALKARLLSTATVDQLLAGAVEGQRLLNIQAAVGP
jgi:subtilisin family serine protease